jgi:hypothetical protein
MSANRRVKIRQPAKNAMQSGRAKATAKPWVLEYELETKRAPEPIMGWIGSGDTLNQVSLRFSTVEQAVAYADAQGWDYDIEQPHTRIVKGRTYLDNFLAPPVMAKVKTGQ